MQKTTNWSTVWGVVSSIGVVLLLGLSFFSAPAVFNNDNTDVLERLDVIEANHLLDSDDPNTALLLEIHKEVTEDAAWEDRAEEIATEEWSERDNKDLYRAINDIYGDLDDEGDIIYVREDESTDFINMDADDKDGIVKQYLKVKYEDEDGDDRKVYVTVETEFDEGDLENQSFSKTR